MRALSAADLLVCRCGDDLVVRSRTTTTQLDFLETIGELLSATVINAFSPLALGAHRPRVTIDRLVLARECWMYPVQQLQWVFRKDEQDRYAQARAWRSRHGLPERSFVKMPTEIKPFALDFRSLPLVNLFAKAARKAATVDGATVSITEMLPDLDQLWLPDVQDNRYTAELRFVAIDRYEEKV